jgi:hypothetical protein
VTRKSPMATLSRLSQPTLGVFRGSAAVARGVTRKQIATLAACGAVERLYPDTYRMTAVRSSPEQALRAALTWAGSESAGAVRSAGEQYRLEGVRAPVPEIVVPHRRRPRGDGVVVHRSDNTAAMMLRNQGDFRVTGIEPTLVALAHALDGEAFEVACEDARRRGLTSLSALRSYLARFGAPGRPGVARTRRLLDELDPRCPARSPLEVKTRRLLVAHGLTDFVREFPLAWNGRVYEFDFCFPCRQTILETNGRRWHDDPTDYEYDSEKWSVPGRLGYRIVFATWAKVTRQPDQLIAELITTMAAPTPTTTALSGR